MTLIVAVYVPLAFVTSYFGMNVKEFIGGDFISVKTFWQISIPLVVATIGLPLIATIVARTTVAITAAANSYSRRRWPVLVDITLAVFFTACVYVRVFTKIQGDTPKEKATEKAAEIDLVIAILAFLKTIEQSIYRKKSARRGFFAWLGLTVTAALCAGLYRLNTYSWRLMTLIPISYLMIMVIVMTGWHCYNLRLGRCKTAKPGE
jgi:hypothetical protein